MLPKLLGDGLGHTMAGSMSPLNLAVLGLDPGDGGGEVCGEGVVCILVDEGDGVGDVFGVAYLFIIGIPPGLIGACGG